jgi:hypothetical protein
MKRKTRILLASVIIPLSMIACNLQPMPIAGEWEGEGITFTICATQDTITQLNVVIPYEGEYLAQMYYSLDISERKFSSFRDGNSYLGIPEANLEGEFLSNKLAKGTFNGISWTAIPSSKNKE